MIFLWLVIAILAAIGEVLSTGLFLATVAAAGVTTAVVSIFVTSATFQIALFGVLALVGVTVLRPTLIRTFGIESLGQLVGPVTHSHVVGRRATAVSTVDGSGGQIRIGQGEFWSARAYDASEIIPAGAQVEVLLVEGLTALVAPLPPALSLDRENAETSDLSTDKGA